MIGCFHHFGGLWSCEQGTTRKLHAGFRGGPNLDSVRLTVEEKQCFTLVLTCPNLSEPVQTCPQYSDNVRSQHNVIFCTFECSYFSVLRPILLKLHVLTRLIEFFPTVCRLWKCIKIENDPSRSPCLKTVYRKNF